MVGMIINISDRKDAKFLLYNNTLSVEIKFHRLISRKAHNNASPRARNMAAEGMFLFSHTRGYA